MLIRLLIPLTYYPKSCDLLSRVAHLKDVFVDHSRHWILFLKKTGGRRARAHQGRGRRPGSDESSGDGGPDEAATLIADAAAELATLARRHKLDMLNFLLRMAQLEAEERLRLRSRRNLS
jgi:hypothetical protein